MSLSIKIISKSDWLDSLADWANVGVGLIALVVAGISIWISIRALRHQEEHNKLSVRPIPLISLANYEDLIRAKIVNNGIGPMILKSVKVTDGEKQGSDIICFMPELPDGVYWTNFTSVFEGRAIPPQGEVIFIEFRCDNADPRQTSYRNSCRKILAGLTVTCEYEDIYGQDFTPCSRALTWFA